MSRAIYNATVIPAVIRLISEKYQIDEKTAMNEFYHSVTAECLNDAETGLYGQSALYIFSLFADEKSRK